MKPTTLRRLAWVSCAFSVGLLLAGILATVWVGTDGVVSSVLLTLILMAFTVAGISIARSQPQNRRRFGGVGAAAEPSFLIRAQ